MTSVSTVSGGTTGTHDSYGSATPSYDTDSEINGSSGGSRSGSAKSYDGTGVPENRCPRGAPACVSANSKRRARRRALCGHGAVLAGEGVTA